MPTRGSAPPLRMIRVRGAAHAWAFAYAPGMDAALTATAIGVGGTVIVGVAGFWANVRNTNKTTALALQGQVTERYNKAVEQLGSKEIDVRVGGIYALERIARDSARDQPTVMEVLAAFVRDHSREQWPLPTAYEVGADPPARMTRPDVQAAVTVIGRRTIRPGGQRIDLNQANLTRAYLYRANLTLVNLYRATFTPANLTEADLTRANLTEADLTRANLARANLTRANLTRATFALATLTGADLTDATLIYTDLTDATLTGAKFTGADLTGALWPLDKVAVVDGWQEDGASGRLKRADTSSGDAAGDSTP